MRSSQPYAKLSEMAAPTEKLDVNDEQRLARADARRRTWGSRLTTLDGHSNLSATTPDAALSVMWELAQQAWALSGRPSPTYSRATMPGRLIRLTVSETPDR